MSAQYIRQKLTANQGESTFITLANEGYEILCNLSPSQNYPAGVELFKQGSLTDYVYFIESGLVKITSLCESGRELITCLRSPGWLLGVTSVVLQKPNLVQATTLTYCHLRVISAATFLDLLASNIRFASFSQQALSREVYEQITPMVELGCCSARHRLERFLWELASEVRQFGSQEEVCLRMPLRHWEVAQLLAITPAYLSRLFNQLEKERILRRKKGLLIIPDPQRLWHDNAF